MKRWFFSCYFWGFRTRLLFTRFLGLSDCEGNSGRTRQWIICGPYDRQCRRDIGRYVSTDKVTASRLHSARKFLRSPLCRRPETRNPEPETRNSNPETRNPKPGTRNPEPETRDGPDRNVVLFARFLGLTDKTLDGESSLPLEGLNFFLDVRTPSSSLLLYYSPA